MMAAIKSALGLSPNTASPVLKTKLTITISSDFPHTLKRDEFTVNATR